MTQDRNSPNSEDSTCPLAAAVNDGYCQVNTLKNVSASNGNTIHGTFKRAIEVTFSPYKRKREDQEPTEAKKPRIQSVTENILNCDKENTVPELIVVIEPLDVKPKAAENCGCEIKEINTVVAKPFRKSVTLTDEELELRKQRRNEYLSKFATIGLKYSKFLEQKIHTSEPSSSKANAPPRKQKLDITQHLNFFTGQLRPYQLEGVTWLTLLYENSINGILADEMGLGKTIQIIALFAHLYERRAAGPFLVVAPMSTLSNWESEFKKFAPQLPVIRLQGSKSEREEQKMRIQRNHKFDGRSVNPVVVCSYQVPLSEEAFLRKFHWHYIVVDEGQKIKNADSKLSLQLRALKSTNRTLLTGTPLQNDITELWALFNFLMPDLFKDRDGFSTLIELEDMRDTDKLLENETTTRVIETIHKVLAPFMLRREKKFVLTDLVPKKEVIIYCPLTEVQEYQYMATLQYDMNKLMMGTLNKGPIEGTKRRCTLQKKKPKRNITESYNLVHNKNVPLDLPDRPYLLDLITTNPAMMLRKIVCHPYLVWTPLEKPQKPLTLYVSEDLIKHSGKLMILDDMLPRLKAGGHKVLIFSTLVMFMDLIEEMLIMRDYSYRRLDGNRSAADRTRNIEEFSNNDDIFVFLLSTRAGGLGLNLTAADTVIFMDRDWNPMADLQAQDRCHRIGQTKPVMIYSLITKGTIDELILTRGDMKKRLEKIVLQEGKFKTLKKNFSVNDLKELEKLLKEVDMTVKIRCNGLIYTDEEWEEILDRQELFDQMKKMELDKI